MELGADRKAAGLPLIGNSDGAICQVARRGASAISADLRPGVPGGAAAVGVTLTRARRVAVIDLCCRWRPAGIGQSKMRILAGPSAGRECLAGLREESG